MVGSPYNRAEASQITAELESDTASSLFSPCLLCVKPHSLVEREVSKPVSPLRRDISRQCEGHASPKCVSSGCLCVCGLR